MVATVEQTVTESYRRQARRLRSLHRKSPHRLHEALRDLARKADAHQPEAIIARTPSQSQQFAASIVGAMDGPVLRFSARQSLLRQAEDMGLSRFDGNLLIAAVQHRLGGQSGHDEIEVLPPRNINRDRLVLTITMLLLQSAIAIAGFMLIRG